MGRNAETVEAVADAEEKIIELGAQVSEQNLKIMDLMEEAVELRREAARDKEAIMLKDSLLVAKGEMLSMLKSKIRGPQLKWQKWTRHSNRPLQVILQL
jgi:hypothetical protein